MQKAMLGEPVDWEDPINRGLVLCLRMNEGMGDTVRDLSLNGNHGTLENFTHPGTPSSGWTPGFRGATLAFDGDNDYVDCGNAVSLPLTTEFSISAWLKVDNISGSKDVINLWKAGDTSNQKFLIYIEDDVIKTNVRNTVNGTQIVSSAKIEVGKWYHIVAKYNGVRTYIYINYSEDSEPFTGTLKTVSIPLLIGKRNDSTYYFGGSIDEVRIYNRALTQSEIARLYMEGMPSKSTTHAYPKYFVFDCATTGAAETFALPLEASGTYDFEVHWGDGSWDIITAHDDAAVTHTYASAGTHQVVIEGSIQGFRFNNGGDCAKMRDIKSWGCLQLGNNGRYFYGCTGLTVSATDLLNLIETTQLESAFRDCSSLTSLNVNLWDISNVTTLQNIFHSCSLLASLDVSNWDVSGVTTLQGAFYGCGVLGTLDVSNWNTSSVAILQSVFGGCSSLTDPDINNWDITSVTNATSFMNGAKALSTAVYDATLIAWEGQVEQPNVTIHFGISKYTGGGAAAVARAALQANGWTITDGGVA